jgi:twinfilin-like protein
MAGLHHISIQYASNGRSLESLIYDNSLDVSGSLEEDLPLISDLLEDNVPSYLLVRMDHPSVEWLAIFYVPDSAKVRDKV